MHPEVVASAAKPAGDPSSATGYCSMAVARARITQRAIELDKFLLICAQFSVITGVDDREFVLFEYRRAKWKSQQVRGGCHKLRRSGRPPFSTAMTSRGCKLNVPLISTSPITRCTDVIIVLSNSLPLALFSSDWIPNFTTCSR